MMVFHIRVPSDEYKFHLDQIFRLGDRIKNTEIRRSVISATRSPLPVESIRSWISIYESFPKPFFAMTPMDLEILG